MKHPVYLALATAALFYLAVTGARGWTPFATLLPFHTGSGSSGLHHK